MVKVLDYGIVVNEIEFHNLHYVHFRTYTREKGMNPLILPAIGQMVHNWPSSQIALAWNNTKRFISH